MSHHVRARHDACPTLSPLALYGRLAQAVGLAVIPTAADDPKHPTIRHWQRMNSQASRRTLASWILKKAGANFGYVPRLSGLVVVDVDPPQDPKTLLRELNITDTPVIIRTPRGGYHFPLQSDAVPTVDLRPHYHTEIRCGALVVAPGSVDAKTGRSYYFERGGYGDFLRLPRLDLARYEALTGKVLRTATNHPQDIDGRGPVHEGRRNQYVFAHLRAHGAAGYFHAYDDVLIEGTHYNLTQCIPPLPDVEIASVAKALTEHEKLRQDAKNRKQVQRSGMNDLFGGPELPAEKSLDATIAELRVFAADWITELLRAQGGYQFEPLALAVMQTFMLRETDVKDVCVELARRGVVGDTWKPDKKRKPHGHHRIALTGT
jgi:hypothetical protein